MWIATGFKHALICAWRHRLWSKIAYSIQPLAYITELFGCCILYTNNKCSCPLWIFSDKCWISWFSDKFMHFMRACKISATYLCQINAAGGSPRSAADAGIVLLSNIYYAFLNHDAYVSFTKFGMYSSRLGLVGRRESAIRSSLAVQSMHWYAAALTAFVMISTRSRAH